MCATEMKKKIKFTRSHNHYNIKNVNTGKQVMTSYSCNVHGQEKLSRFGVAQQPWKSIQDMKYRNEHLQLKLCSSEVHN